MLGFGGYNSVRGYDLFSIIGDSGYFVNVELWSPAVSTDCCCHDELRGLVFYDVGNSYIHSPLVGEDDHVDMQSVGLGFRYNFKPHIQLRADYAWQITDLNLPNMTSDSRFHIGLVVSQEDTNQEYLQNLAKVRRKRRWL